METQHRYRKMVDEAFSPLPILELPFYDHEVMGRRRLLEVGGTLYGDRDPTTRFYVGPPQRVERRGKRYILSLGVPFAQRGKVDVHQKGADLMVRVGAYRRNLALPRSLASLQATSARLDGERLLITFAKEGTKDG